MISLAEQLEEMNEKISLKKLATVVLGSLLESYNSFLTSLNARNANDLDWANVKRHFHNWVFQLLRATVTNF